MTMLERFGAAIVAETATCMRFVISNSIKELNQ
jgi:hypothetical protein